VAILAQSSADFVLTYNFQGTHILGASRGHLCDSVIFLLIMLSKFFSMIKVDYPIFVGTFIGGEGWSNWTSEDELANAWRKSQSQRNNSRQCHHRR